MKRKKSNEIEITIFRFKCKKAQAYKSTITATKPKITISAHMGIEFDRK
jgi:hypothetical protein